MDYDKLDNMSNEDAIKILQTHFQDEWIDFGGAKQAIDKAIELMERQLKNFDVIFVLTVMWQADDPFYPDYEKIDGVFSTLEKAKQRRKIVQKQNNHEYGYKGTHIRVMKIDSVT